MTLAFLLEELAELDRNPTTDYVSARDRTVAAISIACQSHPQDALKHLPTLELALARTAQLRQATLEERHEIQTTLHSLETHLRQLKSFSGPAAADEPLLNRLA